MLVRSSISYGGRLLVERLAPVIQGTTVELLYHPEDRESARLSPPLSLLCPDEKRCSLLQCTSQMTQRDIA